MLARSMIAGAALFFFASNSTLAEVPDVKGPLKLSEKRYTDDGGRMLVIRFKEGKAVQAQATDKQGKPLKVVEIPVKSVTVCVPKAGAAGTPKSLCQPLAFVTDGASIKMGTATCTCQVYGGTLICYGDTCQ